eukprot:TRINITY_DN24587_c0_g1_i8.p1 TRINITY_DN24587_c0_g1~~TRINITY_DN24587_c0_g1_i8.p1  ORF type:complete len:249 (+),score=29.43 TRINITY_DN24587_c0_g1_i8:79-747(+)
MGEPAATAQVPPPPAVPRLPPTEQPQRPRLRTARPLQAEFGRDMDSRCETLRARWRGTLTLGTAGSSWSSCSARFAQPSTARVRDRSIGAGAANHLGQGRALDEIYAQALIDRADGNLSPQRTVLTRLGVHRATSFFSAPAYRRDAHLKLGASSVEVSRFVRLAEFRPRLWDRDVHNLVMHLIWTLLQAAAPAGRGPQDGGAGVSASFCRAVPLLGTPAAML